MPATRAPPQPSRSRPASASADSGQAAPIVAAAPLPATTVADVGLKALKTARPVAHITFMVTKPLVELFSGQPFVDEVVPWSNELWPLIKTLRRGRYDVLLIARDGTTTVFSHHGE